MTFDKSRLVVGLPTILGLGLSGILSVTLSLICYVRYEHLSQSDLANNFPSLMAGGFRKQILAAALLQLILLAVLLARGVSVTLYKYVFSMNSANAILDFHNTFANMVVTFNYLLFTAMDASNNSYYRQTVAAMVFSNLFASYVRGILYAQNAQIAH